MEEIKVSIHKVDKAIILKFDTEQNFCLSSIYTENILSKVESFLVSTGNPVPTEKARDLWRLLRSIGFRRIFELESIFNKKAIDKSTTTYKIRDKKTKMYSTGGRIGCGGNWSSTGGTTWDRKRHLAAFINSTKDAKGDLPDIFEHAEIVQLGELRALDIKDIDELD